MAKQIARLLRSELTVSDELSKIAKLLQSKGRGKDTILAHITPKEAEMLKQMGGRGSKNPETGLLEFEGADDTISGTFDPTDVAEPTMDVSTPEGAENMAKYGATRGQFTVPSEPASGLNVGQFPTQIAETPASYSGYGARLDPSAYRLSAGQFDTSLTPPGLKAPGVEIEGVRAAPTPSAAAPKDFTEKLKDYLSDPANLAKLGLGIGGAGLGAMRARQGAKQIQAATEEQKALGVPYQTQGRELVRAAQAGELTPTSSQAYQAMQAQLAQSQATRGGVGTAQAAAQLEAFRQQLLQNQYTYGLQVANIGDQYVSGAIKTGLQLDQTLQQATSNFYTNLAAIAGGLPVARTTTTA